jgi:vacuolar-type H+-ATPase subunit C/Vma6
MAQTNLNKKEVFYVKPTQIRTVLSEKEMSPLGKKLMKIAKEIENSDEPAFDEADIERELEKRRGGFVRNGE